MNPDFKIRTAQVHF